MLLVLTGKIPGKPKPRPLNRSRTLRKWQSFRIKKLSHCKWFRFFSTGISS